jgi:hypothetical protein
VVLNGYSRGWMLVVTDSSYYTYPIHRGFIAAG